MKGIGIPFKHLQMPYLFMLGFLESFFMPSHMLYKFPVNNLVTEDGEPATLFKVFLARIPMFKSPEWYKGQHY
jgi:hypothetical protein